MALFDTPRMGASAGGAYEVEKSLRINKSDNPQLYRVGSNTSNTYTVSMWIKMTGRFSNYRRLWSTYADGLIINNDSRLRYDDEGDGQAYSAAKYRDPAAWYHIVFRVNTSGTTVYVNGESVISSSMTHSLSTYSPNGLRLFWYPGDPGEFAFEGYGAEAALIDGQALTPSSFAETDALTGQWIPKDLSSLTFGSNGHYLKFTDTSNIGKDFSGNDNHFTSANLSASAGAGNDILDDTPTNNFCTWNASDNHSNITVSNGGLYTSISSGFKLQRATYYLTSGKWYWEVVCDDTGNGFVGVCDSTDSVNDRGGNSSSSCVIRTTNGDKRIGGSETSYGSGVSVGDIMMFAVDMDNGKFWAGKNNSWFNSGDPAAGSNPASSAITNPVTPSLGMYDSENYTGNFGQRAFSYSPPTGFQKICSANLPDPVIAEGNKHFDTKLWSGTGSTHNITGLNFQPDLVWIKKRSGNEAPDIQDSVRGATKRLTTHDNATESTVSGSIDSFNSNGFTVKDAGTTNESGHTYVGWSWKGGGSASSNTNGSITSSVSANTTAGFSILTYTGTGSQTTVGHGLGVAPKVIITKIRDTNTQDWMLYPKQLTGNGATYIKFNATNDVASDAHTYPDVEPTSTVYTVGGDDGGDGTNGNGKAYVAYVFSDVEGYSKFGTYKGNGSTNGTYVFTGFRPAFIITRRYSGGSNWYIWDPVREGNVQNSPIQANDAGGEPGSYDNSLDIFSNGFKLRATNAGTNGNNEDYLYMAFAEAPFKYSRAH